MRDPFELLACPDCARQLCREGAALRCATGHSFDVAREGYVNLLRGNARTETADTPAMLDARSAFLGSGLFAPVIDAVADTVARGVAGGEGCIVDAGAGTGAYLAPVLERLPDRLGLALDLSKHAARRVARIDPRIGAVVCDVWTGLPVRDSVAAAVMSVFAPRNASEFARILQPEGVLVVVTPTARHLAEIIEPLGMVRVHPTKDERLAGGLSERFTRESSQAIDETLALSREDAVAAASMGPSAFHLGDGEAERRAAALGEPMQVTLSVTIGSWRLRPR